MRAIKVPPDHGVSWIRCGADIVRRDAAHWLGMTLIYFVIGLALKQIPFVGDLLVILITPLLLAGVLLYLRERSAAPAGADAAAPVPAEPAPASRSWLERLLLGPARTLFQVTGREEYLFPAIIVCILGLGLIMVTGILEYLLTGGSIISGLAASSLAAPLTVGLAFRMLVLVVLYVLLAMALFFVLPLSLFEGLPPMTAVAESFRACRYNPAALGGFAGVFLVPCILIMYVFALWHWLGYVLVFTVGLVALPAFVAGAWCSYRALYRP
jgi:hypothetical protein